MTVRKKIFVLFLMGVWMALGTAAMVAKRLQTYEAHAVEAPGPLPMLGKAPAAELTGVDGEPYSLASLDGKVWIADFIFTRCSGPCPVMTENMEALQNRFADDDRVRFVSITVDPEFDRPEVLSAYGEKYDADLDTWKFLTSSNESIHDLAVNGFKIGSVDDPLFHSTRFVLVDNEGNIRGYYHGTKDDGVAALANDISRLLAETSG